MSRYAKWIFAGVGWALGGPIGAIIGFLVGSAVGSGQSGSGADSSSSANGDAAQRRFYSNTGSSRDTNVAFMVLVAAILKADGVVRRSELNHVKRFLLVNYGEERGKELLQLIRQMVDQDIPLDDVCRQIKVNTDYTTRYHMLDFLFALGGTDGELHPSELAVLGRIASGFGINPSDLASIKARHLRYGDNGGSSDAAAGSRGAAYGKDPYRVLGIDSSATDEEVRRAYRRLAKKYHPDQIANLSEEMQRNANEQMKEINDAYASIKANRDSLR